METIALLSGVACKVYDDLNDNGLLPNPFHQRLLEGFQYITLTLMSSSNFTLAAFFYIANVANAISNPMEWAKPFELSTLILYPILLCVSIGTIPSLTPMDTLSLIAMVVSLVFEPILIPEETSLRKFGWRFNTSFLLLMLLFSMRAFYTHTTITLLWYGVGYFTVSSLVQMLMLTDLMPHTPSM